jgi:hypothetical protein
VLIEPSDPDEIASLLEAGEYESLVRDAGP